MSYPVQQSKTSTSFDSTVTAMQVSMPSTVDGNDLLIAIVHVRNAGTWTKPSGWNDISGLSQTGGGSVGKLNGFYKIANGSEGGTAPQWDASIGTTAEWQVIQIRGIDNTAPPEAITTSGDNSNADPISLSPSWGANDALYISVAGHSAISAVAWSSGPLNYFDFQCTGASSGGAAVSLASAWYHSPNASENPGNFTASGSNRYWAAATISVKPLGVPSANFGYSNDPFSGLIENGLAASGYRTWYHTCSGVNRALVVSVGLKQNSAPSGTITSMTYNGVPMMQAAGYDSGDSGVRAETWYLINPPSGTYKVSAYVLNDTIDRKFASCSYTGVFGYNGFNVTGGDFGNPVHYFNPSTTGVKDFILQDAVIQNAIATLYTPTSPGNSLVVEASGETSFGAQFKVVNQQELEFVFMQWEGANDFSTWSSSIVSLSKYPTFSSSFLKL